MQAQTSAASPLLKVSVNEKPDHFVNTFITSIGENRQAFDIFKEHAQKKGLMQKEKPLIHSQHDYYERFINPIFKP